MPTMDLHKRFTFYGKSQENENLDHQNNIRNGALGFAMLVDNLCPDCDEKVEAIKNIEQALMWASTAVARHGMARHKSLYPEIGT